LILTGDTIIGVINSAV